MTCKQCKSKRILCVCGKTSDQCSLNHSNTCTYDGYVPGNIGLGNDEDYIEFDYCLDCGQMQGRFPVTERKLPQELRA